MEEELKEFANILFAPSQRDMYKKRIDKAIEYIENNELICYIDYDTKKFKKELLDILKGCDKE